MRQLLCLSGVKSRNLTNPTKEGNGVAYEKVASLQKIEKKRLTSPRRKIYNMGYKQEGGAVRFIINIIMRIRG